MWLCKLRGHNYEKIILNLLACHHIYCTRCGDIKEIFYTTDDNEKDVDIVEDTE